MIPLTPGHCHPWADLLAVSFARTPAEMVQLLAWLQAGPGLIAYGAWDGECLAAQYSCRLTPLYLPHHDSPATVGLSINMAVHPQYRGRGLIKQVAAPVYAEVGARGGLAGVGFSNADGVKVDRQSRGYGYRVVGKLASTIVWLIRPARLSHVTLTDHWPQATFTPATRSSAHIHFQHTPENLYHRFACHPFRQYHFGVWQDAGEICGLVVYRPVRYRGIRGVALLAVYGPDLPALLAGWAAALCAQGMRFIQVVTSHHAPIRSLLPRLGMAVTLPYSRSPHYLTAKAFTTTPAALFDYPQWDCIGGDIL